MNEKELEIYSTGIVHCSICTNIKSYREIERRVNIKNPAGISSGWKISESPTFKDGTPNPSPCNEGRATHKHYLMHARTRYKRSKGKIIRRILSIILIILGLISVIVLSNSGSPRAWMSVFYFIIADQLWIGAI